MTGKKIKTTTLSNNDNWALFWFLCTIVLGSIPLAARFFVSLHHQIPNSFFYVVNPVDLGLLGLAFNWNNINESLHCYNVDNVNKNMVNRYVAFSIVALIFFAMLISGCYFSEASNSLTNNTNSLNVISTWSANLIVIMILTFISGFVSFFFFRSVRQVYK